MLFLQASPTFSKRKDEVMLRSVKESLMKKMK